MPNSMYIVYYKNSYVKCYHIGINESYFPKYILQ